MNRLTGHAWSIVHDEGRGDFQVEFLEGGRSVRVDVECDLDASLEGSGDADGVCSECGDLSLIHI